MEQFDAPIPGQSLTTEPGSRPWEQPAQFTDPDEVMGYYLPRIYARADQLMDLVEAKVPVADIVHPLLMSGVMKGLHSIDVAIIVAAPLTDYIAGLAEVAGIEAVIGDEVNPDEDAQIIDEVMAEPITPEAKPEPQLGEGGGGLMSRPRSEASTAGKGVM